MEEEKDMRCMELEDSCDIVIWSSSVHSEWEIWILTVPSISLPEIHSAIKHEVWMLDYCGFCADSVNCEFNQLQTMCENCVHSEHKQTYPLSLFFKFYNSNLHSVHIALGVTINLETI